MPLPVLGLVTLGQRVFAALLIGSFIKQIISVLFGLGVGVVTFTFVLPEFFDFLQNKFASLPTEIENIVGILQVDRAITIILSASAAKLTYNSITN